MSHPPVIAQELAAKRCAPDAELRGSSIRERTRQLIGIAHPKFREALTRSAHEIGYLNS